MVIIHYTHYDYAHMAVNFVITVILVVAKLPEMMGVRLIGKTPSRKQ